MFKRFNSTLRAKSVKPPLNRKGLTLIEVTIVMLIFAALIAVGAPAFSKSFSRAHETQVLSDFAKIQVAAAEFLHEQPDTLKLSSPQTILALNDYLESNFYVVKENDLDQAILTMQDPWGAHYQISFDKGVVTPKDTTITVTSIGGGKVYKLLVHKNLGEIRVGTAGFRNNMGSAFSDATNTPTVSITKMWMDAPTTPEPTDPPQPPEITPTHQIKLDLFAHALDIYTGTPGFPEEFDVINEGSQPTGTLNIAVIGDDIIEFESPTTIDSIPVGDDSTVEYTFKDMPVGAYRTTITVSGDNGLFASCPMLLTVHATPNDIVVNNRILWYSFPNQRQGYSPIAPQGMSLKNEGTQPTGALTLALIEGSEYFELSTTTLASISAGSTVEDAFTVRPKDGLPMGVYRGIVEIQSDSPEVKTISYYLYVLRPLS